MPDGISPGVVAVVDALNRDGFETTDSGDGTNHKNGMEGAMPFKHVAVVFRTERALSQNETLRSWTLDHPELFSDWRGGVIVESSWGTSAPDFILSVLREGDGWDVAEG